MPILEEVEDFIAVECDCWDCNIVRTAVDRGTLDMATIGGLGTVKFLCMSCNDTDNDWCANGHRACAECHTIWGDGIECPRCNPAPGYIAPDNADDDNFPFPIFDTAVNNTGTGGTRITFEHRPREEKKVKCAVCNKETRKGNTLGLTWSRDKERNVPTPNNARCCAECRQDHYIFYCPGCEDYYQLPKAEFNGTPWSMAGPRGAAVVCPQHSEDEDTPITHCDICGELTRIEWCNAANRVYCLGCCDTYGRRFCEQPGCAIYYLNGDPEFDEDTYTCIDGCPDIPRPGWLEDFLEEAGDAYEVGEECECQACSWLRRQEDPDMVDIIHDTCTHCGDTPLPLFEAELIQLMDDRSYCKPCAEEVAPRCRECDERAWAPPYVQPGGPNHTTLIGHFENPLVCRPCTRELDQYKECDTRCGELYHEEGDCRCGGLQQHNYTPPEFIVKTLGGEEATDDTPLLGWELEIETTHPPATRRMAVGMIDPYDWLYAVRDGSLGGHRGQDGLEIISHPATMAWIHDRFDIIKELLLGMADRGFRSFDSPRCGMHVHISKSSMSKLHRLRFVRMIYDYPGLSMAVGQRGRASPGVRDFASFQAEPLDRMVEKVRRGTNHGQDHYVAVNMEKRRTVECRWFQGTLSPSSFLKNIEFVHAIYMFTMKTGVRNTNEANFIDWLYSDRRPRTYKALADFLRKNYLQST